MTTIDTFMLTVVTPLWEMFSTVVSFVLPLISVFLILLFGYLVARVVRELLQHLFKAISMDKVSDKTGLSKMLRHGGVKHGFSHIITAMVSLIVVLMFMIIALRVIGINTLPDMIGIVVAYITPVVTAVFVLLMGHIVAKIVGSLVFWVVANLELPNPKLHERVARWAILLFAIKLTLVELGFGYLFSGTEFHRIWFAGLVLGLALAFGLGGRDAAAKLITKK